VRKIALVRLLFGSLLGGQTPLVDERLAHAHLFLTLAETPDDDAVPFHGRSVPCVTDRYLFHSVGPELQAL